MKDQRVDDKFYFVSGSRLRKSRNLAANPRCAVPVSLGDIDVPHRLPVAVAKPVHDICAAGSFVQQRQRYTVANGGTPRHSANSDHHL